MATSSMANSTPANLTAIQIPCCVCGSLIFPNAANQCGSCLAQDLDISVQLQKGPGTADYATIHQCRQCRRYQQSPKNYIYAEPESPELLAVCLKHIPALQDGKIRILDASWIWTEPHSMRFKLRITAQTEVQNVTIQQRVMTELRCTFQMCPECNREYTNRTWQAVLQVRQRHTTKGLRALEMAIASADAKVRKHVIRLDSTNAGLDFYFMELRQAQHLCQFISSQYPSRTKVTQKFVSEDVKNNTANIKHTISCELAPLAKQDLILFEAKKQIPHSLAGRLALITHVSAGLIQCVDAVTMERVDVTADLYYKYEKFIHTIKCSTIRPIVLDVEALAAPGAALMHQQQQNRKQQQQQQQGEMLHEVQLLCANDEVVTATTHVGIYLTPGDVVLAYDLRNSTVNIQKEWLQHSYELPDVIVIKKTKPVDDDDQDVSQEPSAATSAVGGGGKKLSKKKERRQRKENRRMKELEDRAARMGFIEDNDGSIINNDYNKNDDHNDQGSFSNEIADEVTRLERELQDFDSDE